MMHLLIVIIFTVGYIAIAFEHLLRINKAASALMTGVLCWTIYIVTVEHKRIITLQLTQHIGEIAAILFFLMGAMTIVELIDSHNGFDIIAQRITVSSSRKLLWISTLMTFFLSAVLDNLTATIVMITFLTRLVTDQKTRLLFIGMVVIAANAGGAWSPIGDVTTTMLWIGGQITSGKVITGLFLPSLVSALVPLVIISPFVKGNVPNDSVRESLLRKHEQYSILILGLGCLLFVPVFKTLTHLPPFMGMLFVLAFIWIFTEVLHTGKSIDIKSEYSISGALSRIDLPSILFFLGLLLSVGALEANGDLSRLASWIDSVTSSYNLVVILIGLLSSIIDNVPLVAAAMGMFSLDRFPTDHNFWLFLSYCSGTGGSALVIGSAAGVAAMGIARVNFFWYLKRITPAAILGFFAGAGVFLVISS